MPESKITCPGCGAQMNLHAEKIDYTIDETEDEAPGPDALDLGGILTEIHTCPACGDIETRRQGRVSGAQT